LQYDATTSKIPEDSLAQLNPYLGYLRRGQAVYVRHLPPKDLLSNTLTNQSANQESARAGLDKINSTYVIANKFLLEKIVSK